MKHYLTYHQRFGNILLITGNHLLPSGASVTPAVFININRTATQKTINTLNQLVVSVELRTSRAISLNQISFHSEIRPNEITRLVNRGNQVSLTLLESGEALNLTALCIPFLYNSLFHSGRRTYWIEAALVPLNVICHQSKC